MATVVSGYSASSDSLVRFRSGYIKAIAKAWSDPVYQDRLCSKENILDWDEFNNLLPEGKKLPWSAQVTIHTRAGKDISGFDTQTRWMPGPTAGWFGADDGFVVNLPPAPTDEKDYAEALATYNQMFPTILGLDPNKEKDESTADGIDEDFTNFGCVLLQAIALCWATKDVDPNNNEINKPNFESLLVENGVEALSSFFGFNNPWNFKISFIHSASSENKATWNEEGKNWNDLYNKVVLNYPVAPAGNDEFSEDKMKIVALGSYNACGMYYPFTCA